MRILQIAAVFIFLVAAIMLATGASYISAYDTDGWVAVCAGFLAAILGVLVYIVDLLQKKK